MPHLRPRVITALDVERSQIRSGTKRGDGSAPSQEDTFLAKLIKYIPGEAIATHQALAGFGAGKYAAVVGWLSVVLLPISILWFYYGTKDQGERPQWSQVILCPVALAIWMLVVQSPAVQVVFGEQLVEPLLGSIVLIFSTAVIPLIERLIESILKRLQ